MVEKLVNNLVGRMVREKLIDDKMREEYIYVLQIYLEKIVTIGSILLISIFLGCLFQTILFLLFFTGLRQRTGGYHANTFLLCYLESVGTYIIIFFINPILAENGLVVYVGVIIASAIICLIGTVNHPCMHMSKEELLESKKIAKQVLAIELFVICLAGLLNVEMIIISYMATAVMLCAVLLIISKILRQEVRDV
ncbi:MAG: accessory gene regulator B family protein [Lachnospiraceae bacterium]|nr:accessory gene regulator B family protein [Lachnospiraceae bacterium]